MVTVIMGMYGHLKDYILPSRLSRCGKDTDLSSISQTILKVNSIYQEASLSFLVSIHEASLVKFIFILKKRTLAGFVFR